MGLFPKVSELYHSCWTFNSKVHRTLFYTKNSAMCTTMNIILWTLHLHYLFIFNGYFTLALIFDIPYPSICPDISTNTWTQTLILQVACLTMLMCDKGHETSIHIPLISLLLCRVQWFDSKKIFTSQICVIQRHLMSILYM